jgi:CBS domain containing-hemolysin-like protein
VTEFLLFIVFTLLLILHLVIIAASTSLSNANWARLVLQHEKRDIPPERTLALINFPGRESLSLASLRLLKMLTQFFLFGCTLAIMIKLLPKLYESSITTALYLSIIFIVIFALLLTWIETFVVVYVEQNSEKWAIHVTPLVRGINFILYPFLYIPLMLAKNFISRDETISSVTSEEFKSVLDVGEETGVLEQDERKMIYSVFELGDTIVREIMVPRIDIVALDVNDGINESTKVFLDSGFSRVPIYEETIDNILGVLYAKDLLKAWSGSMTLESLRDLFRPAYFVPEAKKVDELLAEMQDKRIHMAIAVDEYGGVAGLVTLEDIVEEIVGEIRDEYDDREEIFYRQIGENEFLCSGRMNLDDMNELLGRSIPVDEADTLAGLIYSRIGHVPDEGEKVIIDDLVLTVEEVIERRIREVRIQRLQPPDS